MKIFSIPYFIVLIIFLLIITGIAFAPDLTGSILMPIIGRGGGLLIIAGMAYAAAVLLPATGVLMYSYYS